MSGKKCRMKLRIVAFGICLVLMSTERVCAAMECSLMQMSLDGGEIISYLEYADNIDFVEAQIAQYPCENIETVSFDKMKIHTIVLLDNSLSITEVNRENIKNILKQYVQNIPQNEVVSLAVFGEEIQFLAEKMQDTDELMQIIDGIEFHDQDTYLTDYLYQSIQQIENDPMYTRFLIISDGVDNKTLGITKEELNSKLKESSRPIYAIGHVYKDNADELKNMFALARLSGGKELLIEDFENLELIEGEVHNFSDLHSVRMSIPERVMDGGDKNILLRVHTGDDVVEVKGKVSMPFTLAHTEIESESVAESEHVLESVPASEQEIILESVSESEFMLEIVPESEIDKETNIKSDNFDPVKIIGIVILVFAVIAFVLLRTKKNTNQKKETKKEGLKKEMPITPNKPVILEEMYEQTDPDETIILEGRYLLVLRDNANLDRIFRYPLDGHVIVGRNVDMVQIAIDYDLTVSGQHCEFYCKNSRFYVRDLHSANHTYLEGKLVEGETEIQSGNTLRLGKVEFSVEIMPI